MVDWKVEIETGPLSSELAPYVSNGDHTAIDKALNAKTIVVVREVDRRSFVGWLAGTGMRAVVQDVSQDLLSPLRSSALSMLDIILGGGDRGINFAEPENIAILDAWVQANKVTTQHRDALLALASKRISRAEQLGEAIDTTKIGIALKEIA